MRVLIIGSGGHGRVVADALLAAHRQGDDTEPIGFLDDDPSRQGCVHLGLPVLGAVGDLGHIPHDAVIVAVGDNHTRHRLSIDLVARGATLAVACHPSSVVSTDAAIGAGAMLMAGVLVTTGVHVARGAILNTGCVVEHDSNVGPWSHIAPGAVLGGGVVIGAETLVGLGARVLPGVRIGSGVVIGAGAVVVADLPDDVVCVGIPARIRRSTSAAPRQQAPQA